MTTTELQPHFRVKTRNFNLFSKLNKLTLIHCSSFPLRHVTKLFHASYGGVRSFSPALSVDFTQFFPGIEHFVKFSHGTTTIRFSREHSCTPIPCRRSAFMSFGQKKKCPKSARIICSTLSLFFAFLFEGEGG